MEFRGDDQDEDHGDECPHVSRGMRAPPTEDSSVPIVSIVVPFFG